MKRRLPPQVNYKDLQRLCALICFLIVLFGALFMRFYYLQVIQKDHWRSRANRQHHTVIDEPYERGQFFSNVDIGPKSTDPEPLVVNIPMYHLFIDPRSINVAIKEEMIEALKPKVEGKTRSIAFEEQFYKDSRSRKVAVWLSASDKKAIESWWWPFAKKHKIPRNAIYFIRDFKRSYPYGHLLGQVLHTICEEKDPEKGCVPTGGLEAMLSKYLQGKEGKRLLLRSPRRKIGLGTVIREPVNGHSVHLTVNHCLQSIAEEELKKGIALTRAKGGWALMMDPNTGHLLSVAQAPFFDLNHPGDYFTTKEGIDQTRCKGIIDVFEPGSVMKPITLAIALMANEELEKEGKAPFFDPNAKVVCGSMNVPGRGKPLKEFLCRFKNMNMYHALKKSSNVYMAKLIDGVLKHRGSKWYRNVLIEKFGFSRQTGVELPSESFGLVPRPGKMHPNGTLEWSKPTPYSMSFGHNLLASSLQLVRAYSVFANGGYLVTPTLIRKIEDQEGNMTLDHTQPKLTDFPKVLSTPIAKEIIKAMKYTTKHLGSARRADVPGFTEAGKTGTAEKVIDGAYSKDRNMVYFIGVVPADKPRFVLLVLIDEPEKKFYPGFGHNQLAGNSAGVVFREISKRSLEYLGEKPDDPYGYPIGDPRRDPEKADWVKENNELLELLKKWN